MTLSRRQIMRIGLGAVSATGLARVVAQAAPLDQALTALTGGAEVGEGGVQLSIPEIAESGFTVPVEVSAPGATLIAVFAEANPESEVVTFMFGPLAAAPRASTRIRLARSQHVIAVARLADGSFLRTARAVEVTIGGCGA